MKNFMKINLTSNLALANLYKIFRWISMATFGLFDHSKGVFFRLNLPYFEFFSSYSIFIRQFCLLLTFLKQAFCFLPPFFVREAGDLGHRSHILKEGRGLNWFWFNKVKSFDWNLCPRNYMSAASVDGRSTLAKWREQTV